LSSRRDFIGRSLGGISAAWLSSHLSEILAAAEGAHQAARANPRPAFDFFTSAQANEIEAMASQIIPSGATPGAREARVIYFIDRALAGFDREKQGLYKEGLADLQNRTAELQVHPSAETFSQLSTPQQVELLKSIEKTEFFEQVRLHTIMGFLANPEYGGNRDRIGWKLIGFEDRFFYQPPFGFYDRDYKPEPEEG
jgi:gluconate 2-dehydrogenase gamma chain